MDWGLVHEVYHASDALSIAPLSQLIRLYISLNLMTKSMDEVNLYFTLVVVAVVRHHFISSTSLVSAQYTAILFFLL